MSPHEALDAQIAQRLLGWVPVPAHPPPWWRLPEGAIRYGAPPAFSTDPAATALVWQWLETQTGYDYLEIRFDYHLLSVGCHITWYRIHDTIQGSGAGSWPEALCRAALALAGELEGEQG